MLTWSNLQLGVAKKQWLAQTQTCKGLSSQAIPNDQQIGER
jgi:hypothetical protein